MNIRWLIGPAAIASCALFAAAFSITSASASSCSADASVIKPLPPKLPHYYAGSHPHAFAEVLVTVAANGTASSVKILKATDSIIGKATGEAAAHSTYSPEIRNCKPVSGGRYMFHAEVQQP